MSDLTALHAFVSGGVQGVGFRMWAQYTAQRLGLAGWVRNLPDGRVESFAQGEPQSLEAYRQWLRRGPRGAVVVIFVEEPADVDSGLQMFEIR